MTQQNFLEPPGGNFPFAPADIISAEISPAAAVIEEDTFGVSVQVDGYPSATLTYQWKLEGTSISGATSATLAPEVVGNYSVVITASNDLGSDTTEVFATAVAPPDPSDPPILVTAPTITGSGEVGDTITCNSGVWAGLPEPSISFQWRRNGSPISGATSALYVPEDEDNGTSIDCQVTATNEAGAASAITNAVVIETYTAPANTVAPAITGVAQVGQQLTCSTGSWTGNPVPTFEFQWLRNGSNITGATSANYTPQSIDLDQTIACRVTGTNFVGSASATSAGVVITTVDDDWILFDGTWDDTGVWDDADAWVD